MKRSPIMKRLPTHPGEVLAKDVFPAAGLNAASAAVKFGVAESYMADVLKEKAALTQALCDKLGQEFGNSPQFWMNMQKNYDDAVAARRTRSGKRPSGPR